MANRSTWIVAGLLVLLVFIALAVGKPFTLGVPGLTPPTSKSQMLYAVGVNDGATLLTSSFATGKIITSITPATTGNATGMGLRLSAPPCPVGNTACAGRSWVVTIHVICAGRTTLDIAGEYVSNSYSAEWTTWTGVGEHPVYGKANAGESCSVTVFLDWLGGDSQQIGTGQVYWMQFGGKYEMVLWGEPPVAPLQPAPAPLTASATYVAQGFIVTFNGTASGGSGPPYTFDWEFGDGTTGTGPQPPPHTYTAGAHTAKLTVTDSSAKKVSTSVTFTITGSPDTKTGSSSTSAGTGLSIFDNPSRLIVVGGLAVAGGFFFIEAIVRKELRIVFAVVGLLLAGIAVALFIGFI